MTYSNLDTMELNDDDHIIWTVVAPYIDASVDNKIVVGPVVPHRDGPCVPIATKSAIGVATVFHDDYDIPADDLRAIFLKAPLLHPIKTIVFDCATIEDLDATCDYVWQIRRKLRELPGAVRVNENNSLIHTRYTRCEAERVAYEKAGWTREDGHRPMMKWTGIGEPHEPDLSMGAFALQEVRLAQAMIKACGDEIHAVAKRHSFDIRQTFMVADTYINSLVPTGVQTKKQAQKLMRYCNEERALLSALQHPEQEIFGMLSELEGVLVAKAKEEAA